MNGLAVSRCRSRSSAASTSPAAAALDTVRPSPRIRSAAATASTVDFSAAAPLASRTSRGSRCSTVWRSARISSVFTVSMSPAGSTRASTWTTSSSWNARTTWQMASVSRMAARNWLPRPSPFDAPRTRPAMSTKVTEAGTTGAPS